ncbi:MAG: hypothetical protein QG567_702 [Campylobacterota bacterium]|nr:hypothetical protein [Campylobacterota bacterium]
MLNSENLKEIAKITHPFAYALYEITKKNIEIFSKASEHKDTKEMQSILDVERLNLEFREIAAKIKQEEAIAHRIEDAEEVEIEEYYDISGKGNVGLAADLEKNDIKFGLSAEGNKITKRIYRFKAKRKSDEEQP